MRPVRFIAAVVLAATVGMLTLLAAPAGAAPTTAAVVVHVSPSPVVAGHAVTVSGFLAPVPAGAECAGGVTLLSNAFVGTHEFAGVPAIAAPVKPDGTFTATTRIPRSKAAGSYTISGRCGGGNIGASATLVVRAAPPPTTTAAPAPAPPTPGVSQPQAPSPAPAGPATPAAAQAERRWIIPGLAALGSSTLAGLGMWLLYRRRHPARRSRIAH